MSLKSLAALSLSKNANIPNNCKVLVNEAKNYAVNELKSILKDKIIAYKNQNPDYSIQYRTIEDIVRHVNLPTSFYNLLIKSDVTDFSIQDLLDINENLIVENGTLYLSNYNISSLEGLDQIPNINACTALNLDNNKLSTANITQLPVLNRLDLQNNQLTKIDLTQLSALNWLDLQNNEFTNIDLTQLPVSLEQINLSFNNITHVDLSKLPVNLSTLYLNKNNINRINLKVFLDPIEKNRNIHLGLYGNPCTTRPSMQLVRFHKNFGPNVTIDYIRETNLTAARYSVMPSIFALGCAIGYYINK